MTYPEHSKSHQILSRGADHKKHIIIIPNNLLNNRTVPLSFPLSKVSPSRRGETAFLLSPSNAFNSPDLIFNDVFKTNNKKTILNAMNKLFYYYYLKSINEPIKTALLDLAPIYNNVFYTLYFKNKTSTVFPFDMFALNNLLQQIKNSYYEVTPSIFYAILNSKYSFKYKKELLIQFLQSKKELSRLNDYIFLLNYIDDYHQALKNQFDIPSNLLEPYRKFLQESEIPFDILSEIFNSKKFQEEVSRYFHYYRLSFSDIMFKTSISSSQTYIDEEFSIDLAGIILSSWIYKYFNPNSPDDIFYLFQSLLRNYIAYYGITLDESGVENPKISRAIKTILEGMNDNRFQLLSFYLQLDKRNLEENKEITIGGDGNFPTLLDLMYKFYFTYYMRQLMDYIKEKYAIPIISDYINKNIMEIPLSKPTYKSAFDLYNDIKSIDIEKLRQYTEDHKEEIKAVWQKVKFFLYYFNDNIINFNEKNRETLSYLLFKNPFTFLLATMFIERNYKKHLPYTLYNYIKLAIIWDMIIHDDTSKINLYMKMLDYYYNKFQSTKKPLHEDYLYNSISRNHNMFYPYDKEMQREILKLKTLYINRYKDVSIPLSNSPLTPQQFTYIMNIDYAIRTVYKDLFKNTKQFINQFQNNINIDITSMSYAIVYYFFYKFMRMPFQK